MKYIFILLIGIFTSSCSPFEFWDVKKFNISSSELQDGEKVTIIYYSNGPSGTGFYTHAIVKSHLTNDTINILTFPNPDLVNISLNDNIRTYHSKPRISNLTKYVTLTEDMKEKINKIKTNKLSWEKHNKVVRDPEFDYFAVNNFKTIVGSLTKN
jgi:hypothetical protein